MLPPVQTKLALRFFGTVMFLLHACAAETANTDVSKDLGSSTPGATAGRVASAGGAGLASAAGRSGGGAAATATSTVTGTAGAIGQGSAARGGTGATSPVAGKGSSAAAGGSGAAGRAGLAGNGTGGNAGTNGMMVGAAGADAAAGNGETGRMVGITAAHNAVRARQMKPKPEPALPPLAWAPDIAKVAQAYAEKLAAGGDCLNLVHSMAPGYGENLAGYQGTMVKPADVVEGWAAEEECTTYGPITELGNECDKSCAMRKSSNGCGHYTQVVWRGTSEVGCGVASCGSGRTAGEIWVCNYRKPGNFVGQKYY